jgi:glucose-6-phosphate-specific signal transduction histidine kinase
MTTMEQRSLVEKIFGRPRTWAVWAWAALAVVWIVLALVDPSGFHTVMAIAWSVLAAVQLAATFVARRQDRRRAREVEADEITR